MTFSAHAFNPLFTERDSYIYSVFLEKANGEPCTTSVECRYSDALCIANLCACPTNRYEDTTGCLPSRFTLFQCWLYRILKAFANSLDPDETPQNVASHQDPNCLLF
ncbi:hypothetical protein DPMN_165622 [Dreissena polymorpha]|uniref:EB domain-containing protein n=1 Tax=Dreissena polymorpha TaxID=45954 RepID=A0A9D4EXY1_DREPO|nr:hypothetical protein DPMN_165622 [Dreissena polymorpha]